MKSGFYEQNADNFAYITLMHGHENFTHAHFHNSIEILFVANGEFVVRGNGEECKLVKGDIFFADNFVTHLYRSGENAEYYIIVMSDIYMNNFRSVYGNKIFPMFMTEHKNETDLIFSTLAQTFKEWKNYNSLMKHGFADLILGLIARIYEPESIKTHKEGLFIADVLRYIDTNYDQPLSLLSVSDKFGYSPNYFSTLFNRYTDMSFREYLNRVRVRETAAMLKTDPNLSLAKAARLCGFVSLNTYYRAVKSNPPEK